MTQFAVFRNPGRNAEVPFVVQIQSRRLTAGLGRVVMALVRCGARSPRDHPLTPHLIVEGQAVYADPMDIGTVRVATLKAPVCVLEERDQDRIVRAIDEMISRA